MSPNTLLRFGFSPCETNEEGDTAMHHCVMNHDCDDDDDDDDDDNDTDDLTGTGGGAPVVFGPVRRTHNPKPRTSHPTSFRRNVESPACQTLAIAWR